MAKNVMVNCSVNTCHYWRQGNICDAQQIMVTADSMAAAAPDRIDAPLANEVTPTPVDNCMQTCCKTFVHKTASGRAKRMDGVQLQ